MKIYYLFGCGRVKYGKGTVSRNRLVLKSIANQWGLTLYVLKTAILSISTNPKYHCPEGSLQRPIMCIYIRPNTPLKNRNILVILHFHKFFSKRKKWDYHIESICRRLLKCGNLVLDRVENIVEKEKYWLPTMFSSMVSSTFSLSCNVFIRLLLQDRLKLGLSY